MGAQTFTQLAKGATAGEAFRSAVEQARYDYGHAGYTGTIAEKHDFIMLKADADRIASIKEMPYGLGYEPDNPDWEAVDDKWGPAGCYDLGEGQFLFFGWASS